jgi:uncharacterized protein
VTDGDLVVHLARFAGVLRARGVAVGVGDEVDGATALTLVDLADRLEVHRALRTALKVRRKDWETFDAAFGRFWSLGTDAASRTLPTTRQGMDALPRGRLNAVAADAGGDGGASAGGDTPGWSAEAMLRRKPFEQCTAADFAAMERLMARLAVKLATRRSRRLVPTRGRGAADLRRSLRRSLATGGELISLARRARPIEQPRLVVLADTSGSMDAHTRFLLAFVLSLRRVAAGTEVFTFNTALQRVTPWLKPGNVAATLDRLAAGVPDWSGGTRIGESLAEFVARWAGTCVGSRTVVLILSDGLDRGDTSLVAGAMRALKAKARRVIWLNPLAGDERYEPTARAMAAAMPFIDRLAPAHDLESLERIVPDLVP